MLADHALLASPAEPMLPPAVVRQRIVHAARAPRVPHLGPTRPWAALAAAVLVAAFGLAVLLAALFPSPEAGTQGSSSPRTSAPVPTASPSALPSPTSDVFRAVARGHFVPDNEFASGALDVDIELIGRIEDGGTATISVIGPFGESWTGRATETVFWVDRSGPRPVWVAFMVGCKTGTSCEAFHIMLVDGRDAGGADQIEIDFYESLDAIDLARPHPWFRRSSGTLDVTGDLPTG